eukprot:6150259-Pyramimonas_sp.AAC.1
MQSLGQAWARCDALYCITGILDSYHQCWMQFGPAKVFYSDGEGALNNDTARAVLKAKCIERRIRARGQHATAIEA